ncbi:hypothetical protein XENORESO_017379 [Xenotaenia resolanae]|uniref:Secreted protein n=1 Tax=Xenotaenia resolanae TaxID=208358 RepID=A0ABV0X5U5_9TELE
MMRATSGLNVTAALLCLQFHLITKAHTYTGPTPPPHMHTKAQTVMYGVQWKVAMHCRSYRASGSEQRFHKLTAFTPASLFVCSPKLHTLPRKSIHRPQI